MPTLGVITGLSAGWLIAGGIAAAAPIVAHLLARRGGRLVTFPAVRFVLEAMGEQARRTRLRDIILLSLRVLAVALIALAFDRPGWIGGAKPPLDNGGGEWVIVLDASASMTRAEEGRRLFDIARDQAERFLAELDPAKDRAAVVIAANSPRAALPRLSSNFAALRSAIQETSSTLERADITAALALAKSLPGASDSGAPAERRVVVFSDLQRSQWATANAPAGCRVMLKQIGESAPANLAVTSIGVTPPRPVAGRGATISVVVSNRGGASRSVTVSLEAGDLRREATIDVASDSDSTATFNVMFPAAGPVGVKAAIADQPFTVDDAAYLALEVREARRVGVMTASRPADPASAAYYFATALKPADRSEFEPELLKPSGIAREALERLDGLVICDAGAPDDATLDAVRAYLDSGGGVLWFIDSSPAAETLAKLGERGVRLPIEADGGLITLASDESISLESADFRAPPLRLFDGPPGEALLRSAFGRVAPAHLASASGGALLVSFTGGAPMSAWCPTGKSGAGKLVVVLADIAPPSSDLVKSPLFPVLAQELARFIEPAPMINRPAFVGAPIVTRLFAQKEPAQPVTDSLGRAAKLTALSRTTTNEQILSTAPSAAPQLIEFKDSTGKIVGLAASNIDGSESDLRPAPLAEIAAKLERSGAGIESANESLELARRQPTELWPVLLAGAMLLLLLEGTIASWDGKKTGPAIAGGAAGGGAGVLA
ncbi:MAG TPA: BatA domain-containing protein [Phycisphaerales bacterium]|nr:BatA domain-containing protein [Phycisphaerales bacterium]